MLTGRSGGSGNYSYRETTAGSVSVLVAHMPEDHFGFRIVFRHHGEASIPIIKLDPIQAEVLWAALNLMAKDLHWSDRILGEYDRSTDCKVKE